MNSFQIINFLLKPFITSIFTGKLGGTTLFLIKNAKLLFTFHDTINHQDNSVRNNHQNLSRYLRGRNDEVILNDENAILRKNAILKIRCHNVVYSDKIYIEKNAATPEFRKVKRKYKGT